MERKNIQARRELLVEYYQEVVRYLGRFGLDREDLRDAINETYEKAFRNAGSLKDEASAKNWLMVIARNTGIEYKRKCQSAAIIECSFEEDMVQLEDETTYEDDILEQIIMDADIKLLRQCLRKLNKTERAVLMLQFEHGEKLADIAQIIGANLNSTKSIARRAKLKLKDYLIEEGYEHGK